MRRLVSTALRPAFRLRVRELDKPETAETHDVLNRLTKTYLDALRGDRQEAILRVPAPPIAV